MLPELVKALISRHGAPLSLDSSDSRAIAAALPLYPGSALINSISGDLGRMEFLGPLCREWGAPFILLPLKGKTLPVTAPERIAGIEALLAQAEGLGIPRRLILVDVLALTVSSEPMAGVHGLETIRWCVRQGLTTLIGLSNISFGLPARTLINSSFLAMAAGAGLAACIANPGTPRLREMLYASNVLTGKDPGAERFIGAYAQWKPDSGEGGPGAPAGGGAASFAPVVKTVENAVLRGDVEGIEALVERDLAEGCQPFSLVQEKMIPAITEVGARYERREYFLPQLIRSAEAMQRAFARVKPLLEEEKGGAAARPVVILATVEGDIHDIGKNILNLMLSNHGFEVCDLGKDVPAAVIVAEARARNAALIGLSALMTTTMVRMEDTVQLVRAQSLPVQVMIGGAVVTQAYADSIGAHGYAADAVEAVRLAQKLVQG
jgi:5-methyltetrahydrofolate--homocysteine methyltransferase